MRFRTWVWIAVAVEVISTGLAWVVNGDVISSVVVSVLMPIAIAALGLAAGQFALPGKTHTIMRAESWLILVLCAAALIFGIFSSGAAGSLRPPAAVESITLAGGVEAILIVLLVIGLFRIGVVPGAAVFIGVAAAVGQIVSNIDSISLFLIAVSRALMIFFLVLLALARPAEPPAAAEINPA